LLGEDRVVSLSAQAAFQADVEEKRDESVDFLDLRTAKRLVVKFTFRPA